MSTQVALANASTPLPLYARLLGEAWRRLDESLQKAHLEGERLCLGGTFRVRRGTSPLARLLATILRLPPTGDAIATTLTVLRIATGEKWIRSFAGVEMVTTQSIAPDGTMRERFRMVEVVCRLEADRSAIYYRQVGAAVRLGRLRFPLPRRLWPVVEGIEESRGTLMTRVSVRVTVPFVGELISYDGLLAREDRE